MKFYTYHQSGVASSGLSVLGTESYTNGDHSDGKDPAGISYAVGFSSAADMYGMYMGALRHVKDAYLSTGGQLIKVLDTDDPTARPWVADKATSPVIGACYKMLPQLNRVSGQPNKVMDEQGTYYAIGDEGAVERFAWYLRSGYWYVGFAGTGLAEDDQNHAISYYTSLKAWRGSPIYTGSASTMTPTYTDGNYRTYLPPASLNYNYVTGAARPYCIPRITDNLPDSVERLVITDYDGFVTDELKDSGGNWKYASNPAGTSAIRTTINYVRYWLRKSVYPYTG